MFFKTDLLVRSGGEFTLVWLLAHNKVPKTTQSSINDLDIKATCEALLKYLPTGQLTATEVREKMSLYLLANLQYGIVVAFARKTDIALAKLNEAIKNFFQVAMVPKSLKRKAEDGDQKTKKKRRTTTVLEPVQEVAEEEELIDVRNLPTPGPSNRNRVTDLRQITLLEYDQQPQGFFEPDLRDFENMLNMELDELSERSREILLDGVPAQDQMMELEAELTAYEAVLQFTDLEAEQSALEANLQMPDLNETPLAPDFQELEEPQPMELGAEQTAPEASLQLPELTETQLARDVQEEEEPRPERVPRRRRARNLIIDQRIELNDDEIRANLENYDDIRTDRLPAPTLPKLPTFRELFAPFPKYLSHTKEHFGAFFDRTAKLALENMRSREEEANRLQAERANKRTSSIAEDARHRSLPSPYLNHTPQPDGPMVDQTFPEQQSELANILEEPAVEPPRQPVPDDAVRGSQLTASVTLNESAIPFDPTLENTQFPLDGTLNQAGLMDTPVIPVSTDVDLLERIKAAKQDKDFVEFKEFAHKTSRTAMARDFVNMLHLLKNRSVSVEQEAFYGPMLVKTT